MFGIGKNKTKNTMATVKKSDVTSNTQPTQSASDQTLVSTGAAQNKFLQGTVTPGSNQNVQNTVNNTNTLVNQTTSTTPNVNNNATPQASNVAGGNNPQAQQQSSTTADYALPSEEQMTKTRTRIPLKKYRYIVLNSQGKKENSTIICFISILFLN